MANVLVQCPQHGITPGHGINLGPNVTVIAQNSSAQCAKCGAAGPIIDGSYSTNATGQVSAQLWLTDSQYQDLLDALLRAQSLVASGTAKPKVAERRLKEELTPEEKSFIERYFPRDRRVEFAAWISIVVAVLMGLSTQSSDAETEGIIERQSELLDRYEDLVGRYERDGTVPQPPQASPTRQEATPQPSLDPNSSQPEEGQ